MHGMAGASANTSSHVGLTPLHLAAQFEHVDCVRLLVAANGNYAAEDRDSDSPYGTAASVGSLHSIKVTDRAACPRDLRKEPGDI